MELYALQRKTAEAVVSVLPKGGYISRHEVMQQLYSDRGLGDDSQLCLELSKVYKRHKTYTTAYAPGSNRMVERSDKTDKAILRALNVHGKR